VALLESGSRRVFSFSSQARQMTRATAIVGAHCPP